MRELWIFVLKLTSGLFRVHTHGTKFRFRTVTKYCFSSIGNNTISKLSIYYGQKKVNQAPIENIGADLVAKNSHFVAKTGRLATNRPFLLHRAKREGYFRATKSQNVNSETNRSGRIIGKAFRKSTKRVS